jgi:hypothetical protein
MKDYFNPDATYLEKYFCRCFWMHVSPFPSWKPKVLWKKWHVASSRITWS